jgi:hypothetical protein
MQDVTIEEFLTARVDEDEQYARDLIGPHGLRDVGGMVGLSERLLREVEAKRAILAIHHEDGAMCMGCPQTVRTVTTWPCDNVVALAAVWSDHPDYRAEWKP